MRISQITGIVLKFLGLMTLPSSPFFGPLNIRRQHFSPLHYSRYTVLRAYERGGQGTTMTPGLMEFRRPIQMTLRSERPISKSHVKSFISIGDHLISTGKNRWNFEEDLFFFEITSCFGPNSSIFSVYFGLHKITIPSHLSWPRAHVQLSAPLTVL